MDTKENGDGEGKPEEENNEEARDEEQGIANQSSEQKRNYVMTIRLPPIDFYRGTQEVK